MTVAETHQLARGFAQREVREWGFSLKAQPFMCFFVRIFRPRWPQSFARWCGACCWKGHGLPGDPCPRCGADAEDSL